MSTTPDPLRKAAVLVASLDRVSADRLLDQMDEAQARQVRDAVVALGEPDAREQQVVIEEFFRGNSPSATDSLDGVELAGSLSEKLAQSSADTVEEPDVEESHDNLPPFHFLQEANSRRLVPYLTNEQPRTIALVLAHLPPARAAETLASLPAALQAEVVRRLVTQGDVRPEFVREVEQGLLNKLGSDALDYHQQRSGMSSVLDMIRASQPDQGEAILANLARHGLDLVDQIHPEGYTFEDLQGLDNASLAAWVHGADHKLLALALLDRPQSFADRVTNHMSPEAARALRLSQRQPGPVRLKDVETAQRQLVELASRLSVEGRVRWPQARLLVEA